MAAADPAPTTRSRVITWEDPLASMDALATMDGLAYLQAMARGEIPIPPMAALMGFSGFEATEGRVAFRIDPAEYHYNPLGSVHGGMLATLADTALGCAVQSMLPAGTGYTTVDLQIGFVRPVTVGTGEITCTADVLRFGRTIARAIARIEDRDGKLLAHATASHLITAVRGPE